MRIPPLHGPPLFFRPEGIENHWVIILTYTSVIKSLPHSTPSSPTSGAVIHAQGGNGDMLSWPPFRDSLCSSYKCCQWETLNHQTLWGQPVCNDPSGRRCKGLVIGCVRTTLKGHRHSKLPWSQLRSSVQGSSLILPSALPCFFPLDSTVLTPRAPRYTS